MFKEILVSIDDREGRAIVLEDGKAVEILIDRKERQVGSIFKGRVSNVLRGMNAAFVDIGLEKNGFLSADDALTRLGDDIPTESFHKRSITDILKENQETLVQVLKEAAGTKGARITNYVTVPGRYLVLVPSAQYVGVSRRIPSEEERQRLRALAEKLRPEGMGIIVRTAAAGRDEDELTRDMDYLNKTWATIVKKERVSRAPALIHQELPLVDKIMRDILTDDVDRLVIDNASEHAKMIERLEMVAPALVPKVHLYNDKHPLFDMYDVEQEIDKALSRKVWLSSGGYLIVDHTEALWVIDVNTGKYTGNTCLADTILKTNLEACREICRQLRLRDMAGIIIIDFIDMDSQDDQRKIVEFLSDELKKDRTRTHFVSMTELGLVQLTRKREGKDLDGVMRELCPICHGRGKVLSPQSVAVRARREIIREMNKEHYEAAVVSLPPRAAWQFVGDKCQEVEKLEKDIKAVIRVVAHNGIHPESFQVFCGDKSELGDKPLLSVGQQARVTLLEHVHEETSKALAIINGCLVEIANGGDRLGREVVVRVTKSGRFLSEAEIV